MLLKQQVFDISLIDRLHRLRQSIILITAKPRYYLRLILRIHLIRYLKILNLINQQLHKHRTTPSVVLPHQMLFCLVHTRFKLLAAQFQRSKWKSLQQLNYCSWGQA